LEIKEWFYMYSLLRIARNASCVMNKLSFNC
jgi:hypothetical protein